MRLLAALAAAAVLVGCGSERSAVTAGGRVVGDNLTVYTSVPDPARGVGRDMVDASKQAIAQAGGKVGDFGINFVAIDEGSLGKPDPPRVAGAAAEEAIRDPQMIAVVGAVRSDTALTSLPLFNAAGILLVSPGAGYAGFTEPVAAGEPDRWYPSGRPTFARVIEDDSEQARALLRAAGRGKVAIEDEVGKVAAEQVEALTELAGSRLVEDVRRADAVIYVGSDVRNAQGVAESLTREVPSARLVFGDELTRAGLPGRLAPAARRRAVFVTAAPEPGSTPELRAFERDFEGQFGRAPDPYAVLTWRATKGVLDALAVSGRRANLRRVVAERLLASPPPESGFSAFRMRDGAREYL
jgi:ABC-type branched-subunit amino acid transport system substrate-binding protein